jgi:hypothetical protein
MVRALKNGASLDENAMLFRFIAAIKNNNEPTTLCTWVSVVDPPKYLPTL